MPLFHSWRTKGSIIHSISMWNKAACVNFHCTLDALSALSTVADWGCLRGRGDTNKRGTTCILGGHFVTFSPLEGDSRGHIFFNMEAPCVAWCGWIWCLLSPYLPLYAFAFPAVVSHLFSFPAAAQRWVECRCRCVCVCVCVRIQVYGDLWCQTCGPCMLNSSKKEVLIFGFTVLVQCAVV